MNNSGVPSTLVWVLMGMAVLFGLATLLFIVYFIRRDQRKRQCPFCGEPIQPDARLCRFCNRNI